MKQQNGLALLEVVVFLILISLGYIGWMHVRKNISDFDYAMQVTRSLCFYKEQLANYISSNTDTISTAEKEISFSDLGISNTSGYPSSYPEYDIKFYVKNKSGYILVLRNNNQDTYSERDYFTRMVINAAVGFLSVSLFPFTGEPENYSIFDNNASISGADGYYTLSGIDLSKYSRNSVIAIIMVPETVTPFQECYYGF